MPDIPSQRQCAPYISRESVYRNDEVGRITVDAARGRVKDMQSGFLKFYFLESKEAADCSR